MYPAKIRPSTAMLIRGVILLVDIDRNLSKINSEQGKEHKADVSHISEVPNTSKNIERLTDFLCRAFRKNVRVPVVNLSPSSFAFCWCDDGWGWHRRGP